MYHRPLTNTSSLKIAAAYYAVSNSKVLLSFYSYIKSFISKFKFNINSFLYKCYPELRLYNHRATTPRSKGVTRSHLNLIRMTKDEKGLAFFKGLLL